MARRIYGIAGAIIGSPGCYATTTILSLAPLARAGLLLAYHIVRRSDEYADAIFGVGEAPSA